MRVRMMAGIANSRGICMRRTCVGHVVVPQVHHGGADPGAQALLAAAQQRVDGAVHGRRLLHAVQALPRVRQAVPVALAQQVLLCQVPQAEHVVRHLAPQRQRLEHVGVLPLVRVRQPSATAAH